MVAQIKPIQVFVSTDLIFKRSKLNALKVSIFPPELEQFNFDTLYAGELSLEQFQEKLLNMPLKAALRLVLIKDAEKLKDDIRSYILEKINALPEYLILALDCQSTDMREEFWKKILPLAQVYRTVSAQDPDTFFLGRQIESGKCDSALRALHKLLDNSESPQRILGGLRFSCERSAASAEGAKKRLKLLLQCDLDIKRGKLKPEFALERLIVRLCALGNFER